MSTKVDFCGSAREMLRYKFNTLYVMYHHERQTVAIPLILILAFSLLGAVLTALAAGWVTGVGMFFVTLVVLGSVFLLSSPREMSNSLVTPLQIFLTTACIIWLTVMVAILKTFFHLSW